MKKYENKNLCMPFFSIGVMIIIGLWLIASISLHGTSKAQEIKVATEPKVSKELTESIHYGYINRDLLTTLVNTIGQMNNRNIEQQSYCVDNFETHFFAPMVTIGLIVIKVNWIL